MNHEHFVQLDPVVADRATFRYLVKRWREEVFTCGTSAKVEIHKSCILHEIEKPK